MDLYAFSQSAYTEFCFVPSVSDNCNGARLILNPVIAATAIPFPTCLPPPIGRADNAIAWPEVVSRFRPDWNVTIYATYLNLSRRISAATCDSLKQNQGSKDFASQIQSFTTYGNTQLIPSGLKTNPNTSVASVMIGLNDIMLIQLKQWGQLPSTDTSTGNLNDSSSCVMSNLNTLHSLGFRRFALFEIPPADTFAKLGDTPAHAASTKQAVATLNALNAQAAANLVKHTISIFPFVKLMTPMAQLEPSYNFTYPAGKYCSTTCPDPFKYVFTDGLHYSYQAFYLLANAVVRWLDPKWRSGPIFSDVDGSGSF
ncbi:hypothetical protein OC845_001771 [Tilletia horrida]|nr:hypothetical protein OC845_001771 [Tilletia horrida]